MQGCYEGRILNKREEGGGGEAREEGGVRVEETNQ